MEPHKFSLKHITNVVLTLTSEHSSSEDNFEGKLQAKIYSSNQKFEQKGEELMNFMEEQNQESKQIEE